MLSKIVGRIRCWFGRHKRGVRTGTPQYIGESRIGVSFRCSRCGKIWTRVQRVEPLKP